MEIDKCLAEISYTITLKGNYIMCIDDFSMKYASLIVEFYFSNITFIFHR